jgi:hypothetical protein
MATTLTRFESSGILPGGTPKTFCVTAPADNEQARHHRNVNVFQTIRNCLGIFERMRRSMMRRVEACIESRGGHFEHLS